MRSCVCSEFPRLFSSLCSPCFLLASTSFATMWRTNSLCTPADEDLGTLAKYDTLTSYEPNDYHISEATEPYIHESSVENGSPNDLEYDAVTIDKALSSPLFTQEREDDGSRRRACHSQDEGLSSSQSSSVCHDRTGRPVVKPFDSQIRNVQEIPIHNSEREQISILLERQREQILVDCQAEIQKHEFQADKKCSKVERSYRVSQRRNLSRRRTTLTRSTFMKNC